MSALVGRVLKEPKDVVAALRLLVLAGLAMLGLGQPPQHAFLFWFTTCTMPAAVAVTSRPQRLPSAFNAAFALSRSSAMSPPRKYPGSRYPSSRSASVTAGTAPPRP